MQYKYQAKDDQGNWHDVTPMQAVALRCDGVEVRKVAA